MMNLQADLESILDKFNLAVQAFEHEQRRLDRYLSNALEPHSFKDAVTTKLTLQQNKKFKHELVPFCAWVTQLLREFMTWGHFTSSSTATSNTRRNADQGGNGGQGTTGGREQQSGRRGRGGRGRRNGGGGRGGRGDAAAADPDRADTDRLPAAQPGNNHPVRNACLNATRGSTRELRGRRDAGRGTPVRKFGVVETGKLADVDDRGMVAVAVEGVAVKALMLDAGADAWLIARGVLDALEAMGKMLTCSAIFREVVLTTTAGPSMLRNLCCYVEENNKSIEMIVGRPIMKRLGYSADKLLAEARSIGPEWELGDHPTGGSGSDAAHTALQKMCRLQESSRDQTLTTEEAEEVERQETRTATPCMRPTNLTEVIQHLERKVEVATKMGLTVDGRAKLAAALHFRADCFCVESGNDPPVRVTLLKVRGDRTTPLIAAAQYGHLDVVRLLLERGASIELTRSGGSTALITAAYEGHCDIVRLLLEKGADTEKSYDVGYRALTSAAQYGHIDVVEALLGGGAAIDAVSDDGSSALLIAATFGQLEIVRALLGHGASVDLADTYGNTPLMAAVESKNAGVVELLLKAGAFVNAKTTKGDMALCFAVSRGDVECVRLILDHGGDVDQPLDNGCSILQGALAAGQLEAFKLLLPRTADLNTQDDDGDTALHEAITNGHMEAVRSLLDFKSDANVANSIGWTPLIAAAQRGHVDIATLLLENGAEVDTKANDSRTALVLASEEGHVDIVRLLLSHGADVNALASDGQSALMKAAYRGHEDAARLLLDNGASINLTDSSGRNADEIARLNNRSEIRAILLRST
ncbi:hypothetical protein ON010_g15706 [Phytophthora cinnamomi]|nr:hypothetical protein ON010_g15706 [Phytophthora cinnamomi]